MLSITFSQLEKTLHQSWSRETSYCPDQWTSQNPALGQCAVTALIVQDSLGGEIVWARVDGISHYFNRINGETIDLTRSQFSESTHIPEGADRFEGFASTREYILSNEDTK